MNLLKICFCSMLLFTAGLSGQPKRLADFAGYKDPALFTRMPNFYLVNKGSFLEKQFDGYDFMVTVAGKMSRQRVEGHFVAYIYRFDETAGPIPSPLQIVRNFQAAAAKIGGKTMFDSTGPQGTTIMLSRNGQETWAYVQPFYGGKEYHLTIIERQAMQQDIVADSNALQDGLSQTGHVEVPGIFFDTAKSDIKPESEPALGQVAKLLLANPQLRVWVVGHTDNVGSAESNVTLSNARAASVAAYLTQKHGIDAKRLTPRGVGPYSPVAANATEEGRAKNRRVELVSQ